MTETIGLLAATLTTLAFLPQAIKVCRTRKTDGISLTMYALFTLGVATWFAYGLYVGSRPIIFANSITFVFATIIFSLKLRNVLRVRSKRSATC